ncbi:MAG: YHS domain-containing protein [Chitinophagales bacterium]|nr:YHS domain-containing protein [Chitinophagales bacterium]
MNRLFYCTLFGALMLASCNNNQPAAETPAAEEKKIEVQLSDLATDKDLVCGMTVSADGIADTASYEGKLYGFCATECKEEFLKNPSEFLSQQ